MSVKRVSDRWAVIRMAGRTGRWGGLVVVFLWILLGPTTLLRAQGVRYDNIVLGPRGGPVASANIAVCAAGASAGTAPCSPLATIYSDEALTQPLANPMQADSLGNYGFWAAPGHYVVQIYGAGVATRTMNVFLPCDPSNCSMSNATFTSITAGTLNLTGALTVNGRTVATEAKNTDALLYVSPNGSDSNDGLSWGSAKQTLYAAVSELEQQSGASGGTIYVAANSSCGGPVAGQGLWLVGGLDPTYTNPPSGWIVAYHPLRIVGVGVTTWVSNAPGEAGVNLNCGSGTTANLPGLWLSGTEVPLDFENLYFPPNASNALRIGISTSGNRQTGTGGTGISFKDVQFTAESNATAGPAVDIGSNSFWIWFQHSIFAADSSAPAQSDQHQALVVDPGTAGSCTAQSGLIFLDHNVADNGGIHFYGNCQEGGSLTVNDLTTENENDGSPAIWITTTAGNMSSGMYRINDVSVSDATVHPTYAVKVDNLSTNSVGPSSSTIVSNVQGQDINVSGPMTILSQYQENFQNITQDPSATGQVGFVGGRVYGQVDAARRLFSPVASRWANLVSTLPSSWTIQSDGTVTKNYVTGPDGASASALDISQTGGSYQPSVIFDNGNKTYAVGDYVIVGGWFRAPAGGPYPGGNALSVNLASPCVTTPIYGSQYLGGFIKGDGQWEWASAAVKVTTGGTCQTNFTGNFSPTVEMQFFAPVEIHVPGGQISDNEAADIAQNLASFPDGVNPPVETTLRGHPFAFGGSGDNYFATLDHTALTANRTYLFPDTNGAVCLATTCGGHVGQISISSAASGSQSFGSSYNSAPVCVASPTSNPGSTTWWVTTSTSSVTVNLSAAATLTFNYACFGNPN